MNYTIRASNKYPITAQYNASGVIPYRMVIYRAVRLARVTLGSSLGIRYGFITLEGETRIVKSKMQSSGLYGQWELI